MNQPDRDAWTAIVQQLERAAERAKALPPPKRHLVPRQTAARVPEELAEKPRHGPAG